MFWCRGDDPCWSRPGVVVGALDRAVGTGFVVDPGRVGIAAVGMEGDAGGVVDVDILGGGAGPDILAVGSALVGVGTSLV